MSAVDTAPAVDRLPPAAWLMAWLFLGGQGAQLVLRGVNPSDGPWVVASMMLSAVVVTWFMDGVLRARTGRLVTVWILLSVGVSLGFVGFAAGAVEVTVADVVTFAATAAQLGALGLFCTTTYFKDCRARPTLSRAPVTSLLVMAFVTGLLGGLTAPSVDEATSVQLRVGL